MPAQEAMRRELVRTGRLLYDRQLIVAAEGNLSVRLGGDLFLTTPAGACKGELAENDLVLVDTAGRPRYPEGPRPSSEWALHREIYARRPDAGAICHAHPPYATAFACAGRGLPADLLPEAVLLLGDVPLAPCATPGTEDVPDSVRPLLTGRRALLLSNHGAVAWGPDLETARQRLETVERLAQVALLAAALGGPVPLPPEILQRLRAMRGDQD